MTSGWNAGAEDDRRWDRLVDGSLSEREYRAMLAALDEQPDGWRRCALAFLEAQAWGREMRQMRDSWATGEKTAQGGLQRTAALARQRWRAWASIAALVLAAFAAGWNLRRPQPATAPVPSVVENPAARSQPQVVRRGADKPVPSAVPPDWPAVHDPSLENVMLLVNAADGTTRQLEVPVFPHESQFADWLRQAGPGVPTEVEQALRQLGYRVQRDRRLAPVRAAGNRRVFVPVEQVEITPVALQSF